MIKWRFLRGTFFVWLVMVLVVSGVGAEQQDTAVYEPTQLLVGMTNDNNVPYATASAAGSKYLAQYLSGGATGSGWATWNSNGDFAKFYIQDILNQNMTPVLTYYTLLQSSPASGGTERDKLVNNMNNVGTMASYWNDVALFFSKAAQFSDPVILHVEPDLWGHIHGLSSGNNSANYPHTIYVGGSGVAALSGLPNTPEGFARAFFVLRTAAGANNVEIAYHHSRWGTNTDYTYSNPDNATLLGYADAAAAFYSSLNQDFDLTFAEVRDRDAGFYQFIYGDGGAAWWDSTDYANQIAYFGRFNSKTNQPIMLWQVPYGNTVKAEVNNTWTRYQDNAVQTLLGESDYSTLKKYRDSGLIGIIFGGGAGGVTQAYTDGGYFYEQLARYNSAGPLTLSSISGGVVTLSAVYSGSDGQIATLSWTTTVENVTDYEVWSGTTADFTPGTNCAAVSNCTSNGTSTTYVAPVPALGSIVYYKIVAVSGDSRIASDVAIAYYLTNHIYLPILLH